MPCLQLTPHDYFVTLVSEVQLQLHNIMAWAARGYNDVQTSWKSC